MNTDQADAVVAPPTHERLTTETETWTYGADAVLVCVPTVRWVGPDGKDSRLNRETADANEILERYVNDVRAGCSTAMHVLVRHRDDSGTDVTLGLHFIVQTLEASPGDQPGVMAISGLATDGGGRFTRVVYQGGQVGTVTIRNPILSLPEE